MFLAEAAERAMKLWHSVDYAQAGADQTVRALVKVHRKWIGRWYKPWTWFRWRRMYQYEGGLWIIPADGKKPSPNKNGDSFQRL